MKHEIFIKYNSFTDEKALRKDITSIIALPFISRHTLRPDILSSLKGRILTRVNKNHFEILENSFHIYFDSSIPEAIIISLVRKISNLNNVSSCRYNGFTNSESVFPALDIVPDKNPDFFKQQHHFLSPLGIDSMYGWLFPGGSGKGINIFITDTEVTENEDVNYTFIGSSILNGTHGTQVAGLIGSLNNDISGVGIVPDASLYVSWFGDYTGVFEFGKAGDVVNLSVGYRLSGANYPWPIYSENIAKIQLASELGIITCYCSANSSINLDTVDSDGKYFMDKNSEDYIDNSGICVGGAQTLNKLKPEREYNYGSIVDVFAQSNNSYSVFGYFSGTSASTPIISGLVAQIQSIMIANGAEPLSPKALRDLLSNPAVGIQGANSHDNDRAVMPDMRKIMTLLDIPPINNYPEDYGLTNDEKEAIDNAVNELFLDSNHSMLKPKIKLQDILTVQSLVHEEKPSSHKINALEEIIKAVDLYNESNGGELVDNYNFERGDENWILHGENQQLSDMGIIISGKNDRGVLGANYTLPISFGSSTTGMKISSSIEIIEWDKDITAVVTLGYYAPGLDAILDYSLSKVIETTDTAIDIDLIVNFPVSTDGIFPAIGVKGANKILIKVISIKPNPMM